MVQRKGRGSVCGCARGKTSGNGMTISALVHSRHPSSTDSENDFENIGVALGDSVTEFRVERVSEERRWNYESIDKRVILKEPGFSKDEVVCDGCNHNIYHRWASISSHQEVVQFNGAARDLSCN